MNYKIKQEWLEAVMASDLSPATKVYAYGIFKHMFGNKDSSFPGAKGIKEATALATGKYYLHNRALAEAGFLEVTHRRGRSNEYVLSYPPTEEVGTHPQMGGHPPTEGVTPTPFVGTNTTSNPTSKTTKEDNNSTGGPVDESIREEDNVVDLPLTTKDKPWQYKGQNYLSAKHAAEARRQDELDRLWRDEA